MRKSAAAAVLAGALAFGAPCASAQTDSRGPAAPGIISMSLMEGLVAVGRPELAGVFAYVPSEQDTVAFADLLLRDRSALKAFLKKADKDRKAFGVINAWDKDVCLHIVAATAGSGQAGLRPLSKSQLDRVSSLSLTNGVALQFIVERRAAGGRR